MSTGKEASKDTKVQVLAKIESGVDTGHKVTFEKPSEEIRKATPSLDNILQPFEGSNDQKYVSQVAKILIAFIKAPILEDYFESDDSARDKWENVVSEKHGEIGNRLTNENKFRVNMLSNVLKSIETLKLFVETDQTKLDLLQNILQSLDHRLLGQDAEYKKLPTSEKRKIVDQYTLAGVMALRVLANQKITDAMWIYLKNGYQTAAPTSLNDASLFS